MWVLARIVPKSSSHKIINWLAFAWTKLQLGINEAFPSSLSRYPALKDFDLYCLLTDSSNVLWICKCNNGKLAWWQIQDVIFYLEQGKIVLGVMGNNILYNENFTWTSGIFLFVCFCCFSSLLVFNPGLIDYKAGRKYFNFFYSEQYIRTSLNANCFFCFSTELQLL